MRIQQKVDKMWKMNGIKITLCFLLSAMVSIINGNPTCAQIEWEVAVCNAGDQVEGQPDLVITDGTDKVLDISPVIIICRSPPCRAKYPGK